MNKKIIGLIACVILTTTGAFPALATPEVEEKEILEKTTELIENTSTLLDYNYSYVSMGPARLYSKFTFHNGSQNEIQKIQKLLRFSILRPLNPFVWVTNLTFTLQYSTNIFRIRSRLWYATNITEYENGSMVNSTFMYNRQHTVKVYNFTGYFLFVRPRFFRFFCIGQKFFRPARFTIAGFPEKVEILPMPL
jgi:hypothetical protein